MFPTSFTSETMTCTLKEGLDVIFLFFFSWSHIHQVFLHNHFVLSGHVQILSQAILFLKVQDLMSRTLKCVTVQE